MPAGLGCRVRDNEPPERRDVPDEVRDLAVNTGPDPDVTLVKVSVPRQYGFARIVTVTVGALTIHPDSQSTGMSVTSPASTSNVTVSDDPDGDHVKSIPSMYADAAWSLSTICPIRASAPSLSAAGATAMVAVISRFSCNGFRTSSWASLSAAPIHSWRCRGGGNWTLTKPRVSSLRASPSRTSSSTPVLGWGW
jgi:hypothetical protein